MQIEKYDKSSLPLKIEAYEAQLLKSKEEIKNLVKWSEGLLFSKIGLDAGLGIIPFVGGIYTLIMGIWLILQAGKVNAGLQEKFFILLLTIVDIILGLPFIVGAELLLDMLFRVHAWNGTRLISHINSQLLLIEQTRQKLNQVIPVDLKALEDILFRKGKTEEEQKMTYIILGVLIFFVFVGCST